MSRGNGGQQQQSFRDYGATSSGVNAITSIPDVNFSGFSPTEFMSLSESIGRNIAAIKSTYTQLERFDKLIDAGRDKPETFERASKLQHETNHQIEQIENDLSRLTNVVRTGDKSHKLQLSKLTSDFSIVVQKYSKIQQKIATKQKQRLAQQAVEQQQQDDEANQMSESDKQKLIQQQKELGRTLKFEQTLMVERESRIKEIEGNLIDINKTMQNLSVIVNQQGEQINTIEIDIDNTATNVQEANSELQKAATYRQSYRKKILILLIIAVIIGLIVTGIIVSKLKS